ncbi:hypothetical protein NW754_002119 [Fusarium falciforme]|uniref:Uncharacterized protein n=1 Tax=Fusarium falciforme TaxID=195108 RepID=A0A9W8UU98_9HYPO|nr:hypothetical protein NW754_002119 [Fusarium falciforme]KAJ4179954.1 hypothetical protein NW755_012171 [Fusarium falciforme]KAJ4187090.1 hypothetical protein NW767_012422 [Fusarium falciforme]KAJ4260325.1 hypothetical protein NW757_002277 [Fusarium falciforme]
MRRALGQAASELFNLSARSGSCFRFLKKGGTATLPRLFLFPFLSKAGTKHLCRSLTSYHSLARDSPLTIHSFVFDSLLKIDWIALWLLLSVSVPALRFLETLETSPTTTN